MIAVVLAACLSLLFTLVGTPVYIRQLVRRGYGQFIRDDGPESHATKRGTPTMGGVVIVSATIASYLIAHLVTGSWPTVSGLLVLWLAAGLGAIGFLDDYIKVSKQRSLGLRPRGKIIGQGFVGITFAILALNFPNRYGVTPASSAISFIRDTSVDLAFAGVIFGTVLFIVWANLIITAVSNAVNLTDGLDGLAAGASAVVFLGYVMINTWQSTQNCSLMSQARAGCYEVRDPRDLTIVAAALAAACIGFLWWNTSPAKIFMGDTGSLAIGGAIGGLAIMSRTELLLVVMGGLFVIITLSVIIQVASYKLTGKRVFRMAPLQHHFELKGWGEVTIVVRFWIIAVLFVVGAIALFYAEWVSNLAR
ncbi:MULTISPECIES: phospho-N-acetylmuramoyl-pentapeptide-transferase [Brevibacterium]|uniref:Phospho-N-acetylmuramoyl-pentapeptide-transferase n=2 Tax=Brevibacterium TaxID=1696 RepID=A0A849ARF5_9MICO|nr:MULTISPECIES: phospho-N-acetylmuramoyl-pentapeptide-transferase [Brevibacterium]MBD8020197.1 phospho-N-acetylmuramoyl-pentapeptide-transferase [Brevibacterium gallinarum]MBM7528406.1 phospho-N-acetylmuramoyl-pentapeptide-transferase [Brevibacterium luteolum]NNG79389.1 phospho-N-acetylmuramoyl-pentapeptide-transferase [Brevibacterium luteolum]NUL61138.1 phospho-N-acetylmuramoyl-pentapeptide-transferase [Brevibacterium luteolum]